MVGILLSFWNGEWYLFRCSVCFFGRVTLEVFFSITSFASTCSLPVRGTQDWGPGGRSTHSKSGSAYSGQGCRGLTFGEWMIWWFLVEGWKVIVLMDYWILGGGQLGKLKLSLSILAQNILKFIAILNVLLSRFKIQVSFAKDVSTLSVLKSFKLGNRESPTRRSHKCNTWRSLWRHDSALQNMLAAFAEEFFGTSFVRLVL